MSLRISELEPEEVDYLRFDRIKIQRKRMEHILEVIKDLTFKNKELLKQVSQMRQQTEQQRQYRNLYEEIYSERTDLIEKNLTLSNQLGKYRQTALHQEMLINTLKEELGALRSRSYYPKEHYRTEPQFNFRSNSYMTYDQPVVSEEYEVLRAQYLDLQDEYSKLFKQQYSKEKENLDLTGHIYSKKKDKTIYEAEKMLKKAWSSKALELQQADETVNLTRLREKYQKLKKIKKQLGKQVKILEGQLVGYKVREQNLLELIQLLKEKKTKICLCHVNKLEKQLELKSALLENNIDPQ